MRLLLLLLSITANSILCTPWEEVILLVKVLQPDLEAIENYYEKIDKDLVAHIHWPNDIAFDVKREEIGSEVYVKVKGKFVIKGIDYDDLYFRKSEFYVIKQSGKPKTIPLKSEVIYKESGESSGGGVAYLSIWYHSLDDVLDAAKKQYSDSENYLNELYRNEKPMSSIHLASWGEQTRHSLEYCTFGRIGNTFEADGGLQTLIGEMNDNNVRVYDRRTAGYDRLIFHEEAKNITHTYKTYELDSNTENVFGVRMARVGFLEEVRENNLKMLSAQDLDLFHFSPNQHSVFVKTLLLKIKRVEPRIPFDKASCERLGPIEPHQEKFQVKGHILVKKINHKYEQNTMYLDSQCPIAIEFQNDSSYFEIESSEAKLKQLCTDNERLWIESEENDLLLDEDRAIAMFYK